MNSQGQLKDYLASSSSDAGSEIPYLNSAKRQEHLDDEVIRIIDQAQARAAKIITDALFDAQDHIDSMARVAKAASEEAHKVVQSSRDKIMIIEDEIRREAEKLLEITKKQLEDKIRKDVKGPLDELLTDVSDLVKKVQKLNVSLEQWDLAVPPAVDSTNGNGSSREEILGLKHSGHQITKAPGAISSMLDWIIGRP